MVPYVDAVFAMTVVRVLLFVLHVCMLGECARLTAMQVWGWMRYGCGECRSCGWYNVVQVLCLAQLTCYG